MKKILILCLALMLIPIMGFANDVNGAVDWKNGVVRVTGIGFTPSNATNPDQALAYSRRIAVLDSYRNLLEAVKGVQVDAETTIEGMLLTDTIKAKISGMVRGARIVSEEQMANGNYKVVAEVKLFGENSVAQAVLSTPKTTQPLPEPTQVMNVAVANDYTGVIIDAKGLGLERCMSPLIADNKGRGVYGNQYIDVDQVIKYGVVDYSTEEDSTDIKYGRSRAGANPLIIKAISVTDFNRNVVISEEDANKMLAENKKSGFLNKTAVVFIQ